jgi:hypothetical protein
MQAKDVVVWGVARPGSPRLRIVDCGLEDAGCRRPSEVECAKRTQFPPGSGGPRSRGREPIVQDEPNLASAPGNGRGRAGPRYPPESDCAKQSQTWGEWGMWANVIVWGVARPGSETCKTRCPRQKSASAVSIRVSRPKSKPRRADPDFCRRHQTKPNLERLGYVDKGRLAGLGSAGE